MTARGHGKRLVIGSVIAAFFVWLILREVDGQAILSTLAGADMRWVVLGVVVFLAGYAVRIARWQAMLSRSNPRLRWGNCAGPFMISIAANNVLPFRAGDALRCFAFTNVLGAHGGAVVATLLVERLLDLLVLLAFLALAAIAFGVGASGILGTGAWLVAAFAIIVIVALTKPGAFEPVLRHGIRPLAGVAPGVHQALSRTLSQVFATLRHLAEGRRMLILVLWSLLVWTLEGLAFFCAAMAIPAIAAPIGAALALPAATLATLIPGTPGHVGTFDYFASAAMTSLGEAPAAAAAFALLIHLIIWIPPTLIGGLMALRLPNLHLPRLERSGA